MVLKITLFLFLGLLFPLSCYAQLPITEYELGRCLSGYFEGIDLNNNGKLEKIKVTEPCSFYTNLPDYVWGDDTGVLIQIFDDQNKEIFLSEVFRYPLVVKNITVDDADKDGYQEIILSAQNKDDSSFKEFSYGWNGETFELTES